MTRKTLLSLVALAVAAAGCGAQDCSLAPAACPPGSESGGRISTCGGGAGGAALAAERRAVAEGELVHLDAATETLLVLNPYRGLQLVDVATPDAPRVRSTLPLQGHPFAVHLRDGFAFVLVTNDYAAAPVTGEPGRSVLRRASALRVVDLRNPEAPLEVAHLALPGDIITSQAVEGALYVATRRSSFATDRGSGDTVDALEVSRLDLSDPSAPQLRGTLSFPGTASLLQSSSTHFYVGDATDRRRVHAIDLPDLSADLVESALLESPHPVVALDALGDVVRVLAAESLENAPGQQSIRLFQRQGAAFVPAGALELPPSAFEYAARFAGPRVYLNNHLETAGLSVVDLRDPLQLKHVELPVVGIIVELVPHGDRLITVGWAAGATGLDAALFDMADPAAPTELSRIAVGGLSSWTYPDWASSLRLLEAQELLLVPYTLDGYHLQPISVGKTQLTARAAITLDGPVTRAVWHEDRLLAASPQLLRSLDLTRLGDGAAVSSLALSHDVTDVALLGEAHLVTLSSPPALSGVSGRVLELHTVAQPDAAAEASLLLDFVPDKLLADDDGVIVLGRGATAGDRARYVTRVTRGEPATLVASETLRIEAPEGGEIDGPARRVAPGLLVLAGYRSFRENLGQGAWKYVHQLEVIDLLGQRRGSLDLAGDGTGPLLVEDGRLWTSHTAPVDGADASRGVRHFADLLDLADPAAPRIETSLEVPGPLLTVSGNRLFTRAPPADGGSGTGLAYLERQGAEVVLRGTASFEGVLDTVRVDWNLAYAHVRARPTSDVTPEPAGTLVIYALHSNTLAEDSRMNVPYGLSLHQVIGDRLIFSSSPPGAWTPGGDRNSAFDSWLACRGWDLPDGLLVYWLFDGLRPEYESFIPSDGVETEVTLFEQTLFVSGGRYGLYSSWLAQLPEGWIE